MGEMTPSQMAETLYRIQQCDSQISSLRAQIDALPEKHRLEEVEKERQNAELGVSALERELHELKLKQDKLDGELEILSGKIATEEDKLVSGLIMNPKELSAIQAEILFLRKKRDEMETEDLIMLDEIDNLRDKVKGERARLESAKESERLAKEGYRRELAELEEKIAVIERERDGLKEELGDPELVGIYEGLLKDKGGVAVVKMEGGRNCGGCRIEFTRTQIDRFQHEEGIFRCEYCRRILVK